MKPSTELVHILREGGIAVVLTDTLYGILGNAQSLSTVARIYRVKQRSQEKPLIVLVSEITELEKFGVRLTPEITERAMDYWPGPVTLVFPVTESSNSLHLTRGTGTIAFRLPYDEYLLNLLRETGPLVAPSANQEGKEPASDIKKAREYFGDTIDFYDDRGVCNTKNPSKIIMIEGEQVREIRV